MEAVKLEVAQGLLSIVLRENYHGTTQLHSCSYAEIPYDIVYDKEVIEGELLKYDWLHLHHEDFTGQFGKFYRA